MRLLDLGWSESRQAELDGHARPARVVSQAGPQIYVDAGDGEEAVSLPGRFRSGDRAGYPVVGDWVLLDLVEPVVQQLLPRRTALVRRVAGAASHPQVLAANVDVVLVVAAADALNLRRLERMLGAAWDSGATPAVVLTKVDLVADPAAALSEVTGRVPGIKVLPVATRRGVGLDGVVELLPRGTTGVLLGPSGVGKSTLINSLVGAGRADVAEVRADGKGRHTTVRRQVYLVPGAGLLVDTPGIRELQLWDDTGESVSRAFADIEALALKCRFSNCGHHTEPGCEVQAAVAAGTLLPGRLESMRRMATEITESERRPAARARRGRPG